MDPATRDSDVRHTIAAVGSRSVQSAEKFVDKLKASKAPWSWGVEQGQLSETKTYGSYAEVCSDPVRDALSSRPPAHTRTSTSCTSRRP